MRLQYKYAIDVLQKSHISGWCFHRLRKERAVVLEFYDNTRYLGKTQADRLREDLRVQGLHESGKCGFSFIFPDTIDWQRPGKIIVRIADHGTLLTKLPKERQGRHQMQRSPLARYLRRWRPRKAVLQKPVFFMHIPKTAGTTFNTFVRAHFDSEIITHVETYDERDYPELAKQYDYVSGHLGYWCFRRYFPVDQFYWYTLLREPYAQLHSHLNWLRGVAARQDAAFFKAHNEEFRRVAGQLQAEEQLSHGELQRLVDSLPEVAKASLDNCQVRYLLPQQKAWIASSDAEEALRVLHLFHRVGTTEELGVFQQSFLQEHKAPAVVSMQKLNKAGLGALYDHRDPVTREIVHPLVAADLRLYEAVCQQLP
jgi:hypothetical protein